MSRLRALALAVVAVSIPALSAVTAEPPARYKAELILEIRDEKLRIFQYETRELLCHISIIDVQMIGAQASVSCVRKDEAHGNRRPLQK